MPGGGNWIRSTTTRPASPIYDWTGLDPDDEKRNERARSTTSASLLASVNRLAELVENEAGSRGRVGNQNR